MKKTAFTTFDIARICHVSGETVKRWVAQGIIKGYRAGIGRHWRVLPKDLALFLKENNIPFPDSNEIGIDPRALVENKGLAIFCWQFYQDNVGDHVRSQRTCEDCIVYKVKSINCYALREEVKQRKIYCNHSCEQCAYFRFQK
jgi:hypothetical protein